MSQKEANFWNTLGWSRIKVSFTFLVQSSQKWTQNSSLQPSGNPSLLNQTPHAFHGKWWLKKNWMSQNCSVHSYSHTLMVASQELCLYIFYRKVLSSYNILPPLPPINEEVSTTGYILFKKFLVCHFVWIRPLPSKICSCAPVCPARRAVRATSFERILGNYTWLL